MTDRYDHINIENEKTFKIVNSAYEEFGSCDYAKASLNNIIKRAGLSKGVFYHYFKDKKELFDFLVYFSIKILTDDLGKNIDWQDNDFFNRLRQSVVVVLERFQNYPYLMDFFYKHAGKMERLSPYHQTANISPNIKNKFYHYNLDFSRVRENVDIEKLITVSELVISGLTTEAFKKFKLSGDKVDIDFIMNEVDNYLEFLREQFYRKN